jgi:2-phospho-L-lactate guanylyltransferase
MRTAAILPVKSFGRAKQRLRGGFVDRAGLAAAMVADVLDALASVPLDVIVVSAQRFDGAFVVHDPVEAGQSAAAELGIRAAVERGFERVLLVPGDCPALDPSEVRRLLACRERVVIVPDRHGTGTNALLLSPPDAIEPAFGPGSFERHVERAGSDVRVLDIPSLGLDIDTPDDLAALRRALASRPGGASRTRALLRDAA